MRARLLVRTRKLAPHAWAREQTEISRGEGEKEKKKKRRFLSCHINNFFCSMLKKYECASTIANKIEWNRIDGKIQQQ